MSRTDIPPTILAWSLRRMAGDGSMEWVTQPIRASELLDVADMLDENAKLQNDADLLRAMLSQERAEKQSYMAENTNLREYIERKRDLQDFARLVDENSRLRKLVRAAWKCIHTGASCSDCRLIAGGCTLQTAMRELRVEVDGG